MVHSGSSCRIFANPNDWATCVSCCEIYGIDLYYIVETLESYSHVQLFLDEELDLAFDSFINLAGWRKILKSKVLFKDHPIAKRQFEVLGLLDGIVRKYDVEYLFNFRLMWQDMNGDFLMKFFKQYLQIVLDQFNNVGFDKVLAIRNIMKVIRRLKIFQKVPDENADEEETEDYHKYFANVTRTLLSAITEYSCEDSDLVVECIETLCIQPWFQDHIFIAMKDLEQLEFLMYHANARQFEFWGLYTNTCEPELDPVQLFIDDRNYESMQVMLKYGYQYGLRVTDSLSFTHRMPYLHEISVYGKQILHAMEPKELYPILPIFCIFRSDRRTPEDVEMIRFLIRDCSAPYVTPDQLLYFSRCIVKPRFMHKYILACFDYKESEVYSEPYDVSAPRSLLHLCRITIRARLRQNHELPNGLKQLDLPKTLQSYLNLDV